jgi:soluble lytic murein transglycosylase-like protein
MFKEALIITMISVLSREMPDINTKKRTQRRESVVTLSKLAYKVAEREALISRKVDSALLLATMYRESRLNIKTPDGDCKATGWGSSLRKSCPAKGVMQIMSTNRKIFNKLPQSKLDPKIPNKISIKMLYEPELNIRLGYVALHYWKDTCGGPPGVWMTAYRRGKCSRKFKINRIDKEAKIRCKIATIILKKTNSLPKNWKCSSEN